MNAYVYLLGKCHIGYRTIRIWNTNVLKLFFYYKFSFLLFFVVHQGCMLSPCLFNLYAEYIMRNAGLEEAQAGIKIAGRNINNLR